VRARRSNGARLRLVTLSTLLLAATACTGPGLAAGHYGGRAFIALTSMLIVAAAILYVALGREE
jgi:hypothetical protein